MNKKIVTFTLITIFLCAVGMLNIIQSQIELKSDITPANYPIREDADPLPPVPVMVVGQPNPQFEGGTNFIVQESEPSKLPNPTGCHMTQTEIDQLTTQMNNIFNNILDMAQLMRGTTSTAPQPLQDQFSSLLLNQHIPQDRNRTCKALKEIITYLEQLTTLMTSYLLYTLPAKADAITLNKKGFNYEIP